MNRIKRIIFTLIGAFGLLIPGLIAQAIPAHAAPYGWAWSPSVIVVSDKTDGGWPVEQAVAAWNDSRSPVTLIYTTSDCTHCIHVTEVAWIDCAQYGGCPVNGWIGGDTDWTFDSFGPTEAYVRLSNQTSAGATTQRLHDTTHELGHAVGLGHDSGRSVMKPTYKTGDPVAPTSRDFRSLRAVY